MENHLNTLLDFISHHQVYNLIYVNLEGFKMSKSS